MYTLVDMIQKFTQKEIVTLAEQILEFRQRTGGHVPRIVKIMDANPNFLKRFSVHPYYKIKVVSAEVKPDWKEYYSKEKMQEIP